MDTHLLGPVPGCLKMTTTDHQHHVETGDIPGIAGMIEFLTARRTGNAIHGR